MTREDFFELMAKIDDGLLLCEDSVARKKTKTQKKRNLKKTFLKIGIIAASICLVLGVAINTAYRFDRLTAACGASPGKIVDGDYYYSVRGDGIYKYTPGGVSEMQLSTYWYESWQVNEYGIYYEQGRDLYVLRHEDGKREKLYHIGLNEGTHFVFSLADDGNVEITVYDKHAERRSKILIDGKTGEYLKTLIEEVSYKDYNEVYESTLPKSFAVGERTIELVPTDLHEGMYILTENQEPMLPYGVLAYPTPTRYGDIAVFGIWYSGAAEEQPDYTHADYIIRPDGNDRIYRANGYVTGYVDNYIFLMDNENMRLHCLDVATGEEWELEIDREYDFYEVVTDGSYMYTCAPWSHKQSVWRLIRDENGRPTAIELLDNDVTLHQ